MLNRILVPLDGSRLAESALPVAVTLNKLTGAQVTLIHVIEKNPPSTIHGQTHLKTIQDAEIYLNEICKKYFIDNQKIEIHVHEEPVDRIAQSITQHVVEFSSDLLIMCSHGKGGLRDILYGSIAQQIVANKKVPVLVIHPTENSQDQVIQFKNILVPVDGNPEHEQGLAYATEFAKRTGAELFLLLIVPNPRDIQGEQAALGTLLPASMAYMLDELENAAENYMTDQIASLCKQKVEANGEIRRGNPVQEIIHYPDSHPFDLIIIGTHGKTGSDAFWAGSKAAKIISNIKIPVLLIPVEKKDK
jgi:nucleotide-binding universal stress UspA family protein